MKCRHVIDFLNDYLEGTVPAEERAAFERHLVLCPPCKEYLDSYRKTVELGKGAFKGDCGEVLGEMPASLVKAILAAREKK